MELKVLSFNILCTDLPNGDPHYALALRAPRVRRVVESQAPDLMGFQEATPRWLEFLNRDFGEKYELYNVFRSQAAPESTPIAWRKDRFQCLDKGNFWFSDTPETESRGWDQVYRCPRICTWARLRERASGREFCFANTHFGFGAECQAKSCDLLTERARKTDLPWVITGDFNMELSSPGYRLLTQTFRDVNAETARDMGPTFHGFDPEKWGEHIDYCFVSPSVRPLDFRVLREKVEGHFPSDHYPIRATLAL